MKLFFYKITILVLTRFIIIIHLILMCVIFYIYINEIMQLFFR